MRVLGYCGAQLTQPPCAWSVWACKPHKKGGECWRAVAFCAGEKCTARGKQKSSSKPPIGHANNNNVIYTPHSAMCINPHTPRAYILRGVIIPA